MKGLTLKPLVCAMGLTMTLAACSDATAPQAPISNQTAAASQIAADNPFSVITLHHMASLTLPRLPLNIIYRHSSKELLISGLKSRPLLPTPQLRILPILLKHWNTQASYWGKSPVCFIT